MPVNCLEVILKWLILCVVQTQSENYYHEVNPMLKEKLDF